MTLLVVVYNVPWVHPDGQTDGQTDGRYQVHYLPRFAVDNYPQVGEVEISGTLKRIWDDNDYIL